MPIDPALEALFAPNIDMDAIPYDPQALRTLGTLGRRWSYPADVMATTAVVHGTRDDSPNAIAARMSADNRLMVDAKVTSGGGGGSGGSSTPVAYKVFAQNWINLSNTQHIATNQGPMTTIYAVHFVGAESGQSSSFDYGTPVLCVTKAGDTITNSLDLATIGTSHGVNGPIQSNFFMSYTPPMDIKTMLGSTDGMVDIWVAPYGMIDWTLNCAIYYT